jgi:hypothetical protein
VQLASPEVLHGVSFVAALQHRTAIASNKEPIGKQELTYTFRRCGMTLAFQQFARVMKETGMSRATL